MVTSGEFWIGWPRQKFVFFFLLFNFRFFRNPDTYRKQTKNFPVSSKIIPELLPVKGAFFLLNLHGTWVAQSAVAKVFSQLTSLFLFKFMCPCIIENAFAFHLILLVLCTDSLQIVLSMRQRYSKWQCSCSVIGLQTEVQCTCSVAECTLHVTCNLSSVAAVYTGHAVYYGLQAEVYTASTLSWLSRFWLDTLHTAVYPARTLFWLN